MKHLFLIFVATCFLSANSLANVKTSELKGFDLMSLAGSYASDTGDKIEVTVAPVENVQGELFGPSEYEVIATLTLNGMKETYNIYELNTWFDNSYEVNPNKGEFVLKSKVECEDPGCEWNEVILTFTKNKSGTVEVSYDFTYGVEVNDYFDSENIPSDTELNKFCKETFGDLTEANNQDVSYLYCEAYVQGKMN